jgi:hypothetical protein
MIMCVCTLGFYHCLHVVALVEVGWAFGKKQITTFTMMAPMASQFGLKVQSHWSETLPAAKLPNHFPTYPFLTLRVALGAV